MEDLCFYFQLGLKRVLHVIYIPARKVLNLARKEHILVRKSQFPAHNHEMQYLTILLMLERLVQDRPFSLTLVEIEIRSGTLREKKK